MNSREKFISINKMKKNQKIYKIQVIFYLLDKFQVK